MERQLYPPETTGLYPSHHAWSYVHLVPQQPKPHHRSPPPPWGAPALPAHLTVLSSVWTPGHSCASGPPPGVSWSLAPCPPAHLQYLPPSRHRASGRSGNQPPTAALPYFAPAGPVQAPVSPALLHCLARLRQFPSQPHQNKPVPVHLSIAAQVSFIPPEG